QLSFTSYRTYVAEDYQAQLAQQQTAYKTAEKDAQITTQRQRLWLIGTVLILAVFAGSYLLFLSRRLRRKNTENEQLVREKEGLIGEIHHRVKNNLQVIASLLSLQRRALEDAGAINAMRESQGRVEAMGLIHQKLYQGNNIAAVDMSEYLTDLTETLLDAYRLDDRVELNLEVDRLQLDVDTAIPLGLIINELLTNSLKYAFPDARDGKISIDLVRENAGELRLTVADNGVGAADAAQPKGTAFGGNLVELLARKLRGRLEISTARGYSTTLRFREAALAG
ncbi:MAG: sensor histidine kinase, partial [Bacteroidota bacterium]